MRGLLQMTGTTASNVIHLLKYDQQRCMRETSYPCISFTKDQNYKNPKNNHSSRWLTVLHPKSIAKITIPSATVKLRLHLMIKVLGKSAISRISTGHSSPRGSTLWSDMIQQGGQQRISCRRYAQQHSPNIAPPDRNDRGS